MRKGLLYFLLFAVSSVAFCQGSGKAEQVELSKDRLARLTHISELIPSLSGNIYNFSAHIIINSYGKSRQSASNGCGKLNPDGNNKGLLEEEQQVFLRSADIGSKIYIDVKYITQKGGRVKVKTATIRVTG